jgi:hypothetical protein
LKGERNLPANPLTRRCLIEVALGTVAIAAAAPRAQAQQKWSRAEALYQDQPKSGFSCAFCTLFVRPRSCKVVEGDIDPKGWCKFFDIGD